MPSLSMTGFLSTRFGGLGPSMHSLFASITGGAIGTDALCAEKERGEHGSDAEMLTGLSWIEARDGLHEIGWIWGEDLKPPVPTDALRLGFQFGRSQVSSSRPT